MIFKLKPLIHLVIFEKKSEGTKQILFPLKARQKLILKS